MIALGVKITKRNRIPELRRNLRPRAEYILNAAALQVASIARQLCPVDTGFMKSTIAVESYAGDSGGVAKRVVVGAAYAIFVELGTSVSPAQPFLMPAFEAVKPNLLRELEKITKL